jgi:hypothetical protein
LQVEIKKTNDDWAAERKQTASDNRKSKFKWVTGSIAVGIALAKFIF